MKNLSEPTKAKKWNPWSPEEDFFLASVSHTPNLYRLWAKWAKERGWPSRSEKSIKERARFLGEGRQKSDGSDGWISARFLLLCLGLSNTNTLTIDRWAGMGLKVYKEEVKGKKVHLTDFVEFALGVGIDEVVRASYQDRLVIAWLLRTISDWKDKKAPSIPITSSLPKPPKQIYARRRDKNGH